MACNNNGNNSNGNFNANAVRGDFRNGLQAKTISHSYIDNSERHKSQGGHYITELSGTQPGNESTKSNSLVNSEEMVGPGSLGQYRSPACDTLSATQLALDARATELKTKLIVANQEKQKSGTPKVARLNTRVAQMTSDGFPLRENAEIPFTYPTPRSAICDSGKRSAITLTDEDFRDLFSNGKAASELSLEPDFNEEIVPANDRGKIAAQQPSVFLAASNSHITPSRLPRNGGMPACIGIVIEDETLNRNNSATLHNFSDGSDIRRNNAFSTTGATSTDAPKFQSRPQSAIINEQFVQNWRKDRAAIKSSVLRLSQRQDHHDMAQHPKVLESRESLPKEAKVPTLEDITAVNEDLRDWLQITGYFNLEERSKILNRRRALEALDAQRAKILDEVEREDHNSLTTRTPAVTLKLQSTLPVKISSPASTPEHAAEQPSKSLMGCTQASLAAKPTRKRIYSQYVESRDMQDGRDERAAKYDKHDRRPPSNDHYSPRRFSGSPSATSHGWDDMVTHVQRRGHFGSGGSYNRDQDRSLDVQARENHLPFRSFCNDIQRRGKARDRPYIKRGYKGRAYNYQRRFNKRRGR